MSVTTYTSSEDLAQALRDTSSSRIRVTKDASDDLSKAILAKAEHLVGKNEPVMIVCADETGRQKYLKQLTSYQGLAPTILVTMTQLCLSIISDDAVSNAIGRRARVLDDNELDVLLEDMKVSGLKPGRLKEMLKFFYKSISDCDSEEEGWLITSEEQKIYSILEANLDARRALISYELASKAYQGLIETELEIPVMNVLVDDYGTLSKSSQRLIKYLASRILLVVGTEADAWNADEDYPNHEGFLSFVEEFPETSSYIYASEDESVQTETIICADPSSEFSYIAEKAKSLIDEGMTANDILIAVPNSTWKRNIAKALQEKGIAIAADSDREKIKGNPRFEDRAISLKLACFLKLYQNPDDIVALRSWLGLGDWLLRSDAFLELMAYAQEHELTIPDALQSLHSIPERERTTILFKKFDPLLDELKDLQSACSSIGIEEAKHLFEKHQMPLHESMLPYLGTSPEHADIANLAEHAFQPREESNSDGVTIASYRRCHGRHNKVLFFSGLVNGFLPASDAVDDRHSIDHKNNALSRDKRLFDDVEASAQKLIIRTRFEQDLLENTASMNMQASRVFIKDDIRFARIAASEFIQTV